MDRSLQRLQMTDHVASRLNMTQLSSNYVHFVNTEYVVAVIASPGFYFEK